MGTDKNIRLKLKQQRDKMVDWQDLCDFAGVLSWPAVVNA